MGRGLSVALPDLPSLLELLFVRGCVPGLGATRVLMLCLVSDHQSLTPEQPVGSSTYHTTGGEASPAGDSPQLGKLWWPLYPSKTQRHPGQALKDRFTQLTAKLQSPHLLKGRAGRDDVVLSHLLQPLAGPPTYTGCLKFSSHALAAWCHCLYYWFAST